MMWHQATKRTEALQSGTHRASLVVEIPLSAATLEHQSPGANRATTHRYGVLQGQGAYHSSIRDMSKLLAAHLQLQRGGLPHTLAAAMNAAMVPLGSDEFLAQRGEVASAWQIYQAAGSAVIWKSGAAYNCMDAPLLCTHLATR